MKSVHLVLPLLALAAGCTLTPTGFEEKVGPKFCAKFAECIEGFDEDQCLTQHQENPVDTSDCDYDVANAKECLKGIDDAECGTEAEYFYPKLPSACESIYTNCDGDGDDDDDDDDDA